MILKIVKAALGLGALGASALAAGLVVLGNKRVDEWETLTLDDADEGDFVGLSDGAQMHYVTRGDRGSPLVLIHGLMDSTHDWDKNLDALARAHRVWAIDLIGFGFSSRLTEPTYSLKYYARSVREFMDAQGIACASLVGHSLGGAIALEFAHDYPERVDKLILIAPATYLMNIAAAVSFMARVPYVPRALIGWTMTSQRAQWSAVRGALGNPARLDAQEVAHRLRSSRVKGTADALLAFASSPPYSDLPQGLSHITAPALIIWGDKDLAVPVRHGGHHERELANAEFVILEGGGHILHSEYPDAVNRVMLDFLARPSQKTALPGDP